MRQAAGALGSLLIATMATGCDLLLGDTYTVDDLDEYEDYIEGADLYARHGVGMLAFSCDTLREAWVARTQQVSYQPPAPEAVEIGPLISRIFTPDIELALA